MVRNRKDGQEEQEDRDIVEVVKSYSPGKARLYSDNPKDDEDETHPPEIRSAVVPPDRPIGKSKTEGP